MDIIKELSREPPAPTPVARIVVTSTGEEPPPWFLVVDTGNIREQFIADTIQMLFGRQSGGDLHTWRRGGRITIERGAEQ